jgi:hypothetical protein
VSSHSGGWAYGSKLCRRYVGPPPASPEGHAGLTGRLRERRGREEGAIRDWRGGECDPQFEPEAEPIFLAGRTHIPDQGGRR